MSVCKNQSFFLSNQKDESTKDWRLKKETKAYQRFLIEKVRFFFHSFTCIFSDYMAHDITKEF